MSKKASVNMELHPDMLVELARTMLSQHKKETEPHKPCRICRSLRRIVIGAL